MKGNPSQVRENQTRMEGKGKSRGKHKTATKSHTKVQGITKKLGELLKSDIKTEKNELKNRFLK